MCRLCVITCRLCVITCRLCVITCRWPAMLVIVAVLLSCNEALTLSLSCANCSLKNQQSSPQPWTVRVGAYNQRHIKSPLPVPTTPSGGTFMWLCAGSLISTQTVLTAAHCVSGALRERRVVVVRAGDFDAEVQRGCEQDRVVSTINVHPLYRGPADCAHDLALLRLNSPVLEVNDRVQHVQLPPADMHLPAGTLLMMSGWGETVFDDPESTASWQKLAVRRVLPMSACRRVYLAELSRGRHVWDEHYLTCVSAAPASAICQGDSGGPATALLAGDQSVTAVLAGVIAAGIACGNPRYPSINVAVSPHLHWIQQHLH